jgi:Family of unknown function (DUF6232)
MSVGLMGDTVQEQEFFSSDNVYVSLTRFVVNGKTYAMSGITSVNATTILPSRFWPVVLGIIGVFALFAGGSGLGVGLFCIALAACLWLTQRPEYIVLLSAASGEAQALRSQDREYVASIVQALNDCIVARG